MALDFLYPFLLGIAMTRLWQSGVVHRWVERFVEVEERHYDWEER